MRKPKSEFLSVLGILFEIWKLIVDAVKARGGGDDHFRQLLTSDGQSVIEQIADLIVCEKEAVQSLSWWPKPGEAFVLPLDGDAPGNQPLEMLRADGYTDYSKWKHTGVVVVGRQIICCKLVEIGYQPNWVSVQWELAKRGKVPPGQYRQALKAKFAGAPGRPVGIADASWALSNGNARFPYVDVDGTSHFGWTGSAVAERWLWLVVCE